MVEDSRKWSGSFMLAYIGHTLGYVSSGIAGFAISLWLSVEVFPGEEQKAALSAALSAVNLAIALPTVLGAPIAGSWVDRHDRKGTLLASTAGLAGIYGVAAALMMSASRPQAVRPLIILIALRSIAAAFENSAFDASCAMLLLVDMLPRANGLIQTAIAVSNAASPALAGADEKRHGSLSTGTVIIVLGLVSLANCILQLGNPAVVSVEEMGDPGSPS